MSATLVTNNFATNPTLLGIKIERDESCMGEVSQGTLPELNTLVVAYPELNILDAEEVALLNVCVWETCIFSRLHEEKRSTPLFA